MNAHEHDIDLVEAELAAIEADDDDAPLPRHVRVTRGHNRTRTLQVRLNDDEMDRLAELAERTGVPASTFARMLLLQGMDEQLKLPMLSPDMPEVIERIKHAMHNETFNVLLAVALEAEERASGEGSVVQFERSNRPTKKASSGRPVAKRAATGRKAAAKKASARKAPSRQQFTTAATRPKRRSK